MRNSLKFRTHLAFYSPNMPEKTTALKREVFIFYALKYITPILRRFNTQACSVNAVKIRSPQQNLPRKLVPRNALPSSVIAEVLRLDRSGTFGNYKIHSRNDFIIKIAPFQNFSSQKLQPLPSISILN